MSIYKAKRAVAETVKLLLTMAATILVVGGVGFFFIGIALIIATLCGAELPARLGCLSVFGGFLPAVIGNYVFGQLDDVDNALWKWSFK